MEKYHSYKFSGVEWIGEIPSSWETPRLKFLISKTFGGEVIDKSFWGDGDEVLYTTSKIIHKSNYGSFNDERRTTTDDLLLSRNGDGIVHIPPNGCIYTNVVQLIRIKTGFNRRFLWYSLTHQVKPLNSFSDGDFIVSLNKEQWFNLLTPHPSLKEQHQIVLYLDSKIEFIDKLISIKENKINLLIEKRTTLINHVVTKGLKPNVKMKDSGVEWIGEIPEGWLKSKLKYKLKIIGRIGYRGYTVEDLVDEEQGVITLSPSNIVEGELNLEKRTFLSYKKYYESPEIIIEHNDIIYVQRGSTIGKSTIIPINHPEMTINPQLVILKKFDCVPRFIYYFMKSEVIGIQTSNQISGGSTPLITQNSIENFIIVLPITLEEQTDIVEYLDSKTKEINDLVKLEQKKIDLLKEYRQSLITEVVTGKIKVTTDD
jgi:type I restriction enzyme S subunit